MFLFLNAARQAGKSWCHKPITAGSGKGFSKRTRQERTKSFKMSHFQNVKKYFIFFLETDDLGEMYV
jgi:hypothetical protein